MLRHIVRFGFAVLFVTAAHAQDVPIYTDGLLGGFQDYSYGGGSNFTNATPFHNGSPSIAFIGSSSFNAVSFAHPSATFASSNYSSLRFFVNGGNAGFQHLSLMLQTDSAVASTPVLSASVSLDLYVAGGNIPVNAWAQVDVPFSALVFNNDGSFDRIDIQTSTGDQPVLYIDDASLIAAGTLSAIENSIFADGFDGELMFVPQYATSGIKVYQRVNQPVGNAVDFGILRSVTLPSVSAVAISPNTLAFAPDGHLWVVDSGSSKRLLRYTQTAILTSASPAPDVVIGPVGGGAGDIFDMAFFGDSAYVSQSDFGGTNRILKYAISSLGATGNPAPTILTNGGLAVPAGLAFDVQGRLWVTNNSSATIVRMNTTSGAVDKTGLNVGVGATRNALNNAEGIGFDQYGTLWVGNNGEPTLSAYADWQINGATFGLTAPVYQIDNAPGTFQGGGNGFFGGVAFDRRGRLWGNYERDNSVLQFVITAQARAGGGFDSYTNSPARVIAAATTNPGFGGIAFWPIPAALHIH